VRRVCAHYWRHVKPELRVSIVRNFPCKRPNTACCLTFLWRFFQLPYQHYERFRPAGLLKLDPDPPLLPQFGSTTKERLPSFKKSRLCSRSSSIVNQSTILRRMTTATMKTCSRRCFFFLAAMAAVVDARWLRVSDFMPVSGNLLRPSSRSLSGLPSSLAGSFSPINDVRDIVRSEFSRVSRGPSVLVSHSTPYPCILLADPHRSRCEKDGPLPRRADC